MSDPPVELAVALRYVGGDRALLGELVASFSEDYRDRLGTLRAAFREGDRGEAERAAHNLKGVLGILGARRGQALAQDLESMSRDGRLREAPPLLTELETEVGRVVAFFEAGEWKRPA